MVLSVSVSYVVKYVICVFLNAVPKIVLCALGAHTPHKYVCVDCTRETVVCAESTVSGNGVRRDESVCVRARCRRHRQRRGPGRPVCVSV